MRPRALWLPYRVPDAEAAARFYTEHLGLPVVDGWTRDGERGVVLRAAGAAYLELVSGADAGDPAGRAGPPPLAFEVAGRAEVDAGHAGWRPAEPAAAPRHFPRGHYGFEVAGPAGARVLVWSER